VGRGVPESGPGGASGGLVIAVRVEHELTEGLTGGGVVDADVRVSPTRQPNAEVFIFRVESTYAGLPLTFRGWLA